MRLQIKMVIVMTATIVANLVRDLLKVTAVVVKLKKIDKW